MAFDFPGSPTVGAIYTPASGSPSWQWNGTGWMQIAPLSMAPDEVVGGMITIASTAPSSPAVNDVWIDTT
jgi:hypothetical protein